MRPLLHNYRVLEIHKAGTKYIMDLGTAGLDAQVWTLMTHLMVV
jgi:hypothetical protein